MIKTYVFLCGIFLSLLGAVELLLPVRTFEIWKKWINNKLFPLHGLLLIAAGFPLTIYKNSLSGLVFTIGIIIIFIGPFILIYPEKFRTTFNTLPEEMGSDGIRRIIIFNAIIRIIMGILLITSYVISQ